MLEGDDPAGGAFALFLRPHPGAFRELMCAHPGEFAQFFKKNAPGVSPGGGGWALLELTDALKKTRFAKQMVKWPKYIATKFRFDIFDPIECCLVSICE